jgi:hypothetical protein
MLFSLDKQAYGVQLADFVTNLGVMGGNLWEGEGLVGQGSGFVGHVGS